MPCCTIWPIRDSIHSGRQEYTPFTESNDDEDCASQLKANNNCHFYNCNYKL